MDGEVKATLEQGVGESETGNGEKLPCTIRRLDGSANNRTEITSLAIMLTNANDKCNAIKCWWPANTSCSTIAVVSTACGVYLFFFSGYLNFGMHVPTLALQSENLFDSVTVYFRASASVFFLLNVDQRRRCHLAGAHICDCQNDVLCQNH